MDSISSAIMPSDRTETKNIGNSGKNNLAFQLNWQTQTVHILTHWLVEMKSDSPQTQLDERWEKLLNQLSAFIVHVPFLARILSWCQSTLRLREVTVGQQGAIGSSSKE